MSTLLLFGSANVLIVHLTVGIRDFRIFEKCFSDLELDTFQVSMSKSFSRYS